MILSENQPKCLGEKRICVDLPHELTVIKRLTHILKQPLTNLPSLLQLIAREVCDAIDTVQSCMILLWNSQTKQLELTASAEISEEKLPLAKLTDAYMDLLTQVFVIGTSQLLYSKIAVDLPSSMCAVVIESAEVGRLGVLAVDHWNSPQAFDVLVQNLLSVVSEVTTMAIYNAKIIAALAETKQQLAEQNEILKAKNQELETIRQQNQLQHLQLLEAAQLKSQFLATTSHELRTPLNIILGLSQVLLRQRTSTLSEQQVEMVQRILNNGNQLLAKIDDLVDCSKLKSGCLSLQVEEFNLTNLVLKTIAEHFSVAEQKRLNLSFHVNLDNPIIVNNSVSLKQVLVKLLSNAIKFTKTGSVEVKVWELSGDRIAIAVIDTGIGIAEPHLERIFEQFWQVDQTSTRNYGGTGLGLAIAKSLVEMMQGIISVKSQPGEGSIFQIELPRTVVIC